MDLQLIGHNLEILPTVRTYVEKKLSKLNRHLKNMNSVKVELIEQKTKAAEQRFRAQVTIDLDKTLLRAEERAENILAAFDKVVPALDRQIDRYKGKVYRKNKARTGSRSTAREIQILEAPQVVKTKRFPIRVMTVEEAIRQMELLDHSFFLFKNGTTKELNLVYRRTDGNYSLIEPELE